jgi:hypothetical protein
MLGPIPLLAFLLLSGDGRVTATAATVGGSTKGTFDLPSPLSTTPGTMSGVLSNSAGQAVYILKATVQLGATLSPTATTAHGGTIKGYLYKAPFLTAPSLTGMVAIPTHVVSGKFTVKELQVAAPFQVFVGDIDATLTPITPTAVVPPQSGKLLATYQDTSITAGSYEGHWKL